MSKIAIGIIVVCIIITAIMVIATIVAFIYNKISQRKNR